jgi:hypothetical protein
MPFNTSLFERICPWLAAFPIGIWAWYCPFLVPEDMTGDFVSGSLTVSALLVGFLATSKSIMMAYKGSRIFFQLQTGGYLRRMVNYLRFAIISSLLWLAISFLMYFGQPRVLISAWSFAAALSAVSFLRIVFIQSNLIDN